MALYTQDSIERVKEAVDIVELVSARSDLRRVGTRWTGLCPFHDERTPSFSVNAEKGVYYCFGCSESGDAIKFVRETEALDFAAALEFLAERYNVELKREAEDPEAEKRRQRRDRLLKLLDRTAEYYSRVLWESAEARHARDYLAERGLGEEVLREFRVGYSPGAWDRVVKGADRDGYAPDEVAAAGLAQRGRQGGFYDRFRSRIMFPLADPRGRVLGFGARRLGEDAAGPKYLNTSENELYHKGRQLFGIDRARAAAAKAGRVIAVEGYTDVLALHQAGVREAVAIMGTAVTPEQLAELGRAATEVFFALDADSAGQEAMARAARGAAERGVELRVVPLPPGTDPADLIEKQGPEAFAALIDRAIEVPEFEIRRILDDAELDSPGGRDRALSAVLPVIRTVPSNTATWDHLMRYTADRLSVAPEVLRTQISASATSSGPLSLAPGERVGVPHTSRLPSIEAVSSTERAFLAMCLAQGETGRRYLDGLHDDHFSSQPLRRVRDHLRTHFADPLGALPDDDPALAALITQVVFLAEEQPASESVLRLTWLQLELRRTERRLRHAAESADYDSQRALWPEREGLRREIDELMGQTQ
ncbi:MAG: primase [Thermoleophilaceae bacterium]|nr:primase [Thermoleophilaceae bacterium]